MRARQQADFGRAAVVSFFRELRGLDKPDPEINRVWPLEAERRLVAYRYGKVEGIPAEEIFGKCRCASVAWAGPVKCLRSGMSRLRNVGTSHVRS